MLRLLKFLFTGTWHECTFVQIDVHSVSTNCGRTHRIKEINHTYVSRCTGCGKIHSKTISV